MLTTHNGPAMDLQFFAEEEAVEPQEEAQPSSLSDFLERSSSSEEVPVENEGESETQEPQEEELILGKFKSQDDLAQAYQQAQRKISEYGQQQSQGQKALEEMRGQLRQLQDHFLKRQPEEQKPSAEDLEKQREEWLDKFHEAPIETIEQEIKRRVGEAVSPIQQKLQYQEQVSQYQQQVEEIRKNNSDFDDYLPQMSEIIQKQGQHLANMPNAVEVAYNMAKAQSMGKPEDLLQDQNFRQKIMQNEGIRNEILKNYAQGVQEKQPPVVIGNQHGEVPSTPPDELKTTQDAKKATVNFFQRMMGNSQ